MLGDDARGAALAPARDDSPGAVAARRWGRLSLVCGGLAIVCFAALTLIGVGVGMELLKQLGRAPTEDEVGAALQSSSWAPMAQGFSLALMVLSLFGAVSGLLSLIQKRSLIGWIGLAIGGMFTICLCSGMMMLLVNLA